MLVFLLNYLNSAHTVNGLAMSIFYIKSTMNTLSPNIPAYATKSGIVTPQT